MNQRKETPNLSPLENAVMQVIWQRGTALAEDIRLALAAEHDLKDSTVRTLLRRLEVKGVVTHTVDGRAFVYRATIQPKHLAAGAVQGIADRILDGSISSLLLGMADDSMISAEELRRLADLIDAAEKQQEQMSGKRSKRKKR